MSDQQGSWPQQDQAAQIPPQPYAAAPQPYAPGQPPYGAPPAPPASNGLAIAALILGILPTGLIGLVVGIIALVKAGKTGAGKAMAWVGIVLSILWMAGGIALAVAVSDNVAKALDPGCVSVEAQANEWKNMGSETDPAKVAANIQNVISELKADEAKTKSATVKAKLQTLRKDFEELQSGMQTGKVAPDLISRLTTDGNAVDVACGRKSSS